MAVRVAFLFAALVCGAFMTGVYAQACPQQGMITLKSRRLDKTTGTDNYVNAGFSFEKNTNGELGKKITRNDWDILFSTIRNFDGSVHKNIFDVTTVVDDRSRLADLGKLEWTDDFRIPALPAFEKPARERSAEAIVGHIYLVHTVDSDSDLYALFRVDEMESGESATITWKLIPTPLYA